MLRKQIGKIQFIGYLKAAHLAKDLGVAKNDDSVLGSRQRHIQSARVVQETDTLVFVASYTTEDNVVLLTTLECVHAGHFNLLVQILLKRTIELHVVDNVRSLPFVWCDDTNLAWDNA